MRRLIAMLATAALIGGPLAMGGTAQARDHRDGGGERRAEGGRGREAAPVARGEDRGGRERGGPQRDGEARRNYGGPRGDNGPPPQTYAPQNAPNARRGGYLAPEAGGPVADYGRYRLRQPPRGYAWVRTADGYAMVSIATGQVFDVVPF
jgi:Ni/Co efflux regulator RcnB